MKQKYAAAVSGIMLCATAPLQAQDDVDTIPVEDGTEQEAAASTSIPYTFVTAGVAFTDIDNTDVDFTSFGIGGSFLLTDDVFLAGSASIGETDEFTDPFNGDSTKLEQSVFSLGAGYRYGLTPTVDLTAQLRAVQADVEVFGFSDDDTGYLIGAGIRAMVLPALEVNGGVSYIDIFDGDDTEIGASAFYTFLQGLGVGLSFGVTDDAKTVGASVRYVF